MQLQCSPKETDLVFLYLMLIYALIGNEGG